MASDKKSLKTIWHNMPPKHRVGALLGSLVSIVVITSIVLTPSAPQLKPKQPLAQVDLGLPGGGKDLSIEKLSALTAALTQSQKDMKNQLEETKKNLAATQNKPPSQSEQSALEELSNLKKEIEAQKNGKQSKHSLDDALPNDDTQTELHAQSKPGKKHSSEISTEPVQPAEIGELPTFKVVDDGYQQQEEKMGAEKEKKEPAVFLPAGSTFEAVLLNGMDAPTSNVTMKNPVPAVMRIKTDAIMPNRYRYDVRECFVIVSGYGVLSTERANLQTVTLSCIKANGLVIEAKLEGYVVGEDGKVGMRGRVITKQGALIAKSFMAGFFSGIASNLSPVSVPQLNTTPGNTTQYQSPNVGAIATAGTAQGITQSAQQISKFYLDMAKEMFPVIEIDAGRRASIMLVKGIELNFREAGKQ